jgi:hypothetical protein
LIDPRLQVLQFGFKLPALQNAEPPAPADPQRHLRQGSENQRRAQDRKQQTHVVTQP